MKNIKVIITLATTFLIIFILSLHLNVILAIPMLLFCLSPFVLAWMVIGILKDKRSSNKRFSDGHFYEDYDHKTGKFLPHLKE